MSISDKVAYIKGLADGLVLDENNKQDKLIKAIIDALDDIAAEINYLEESYDDLCAVSYTHLDVYKRQA